MPGERLQTWRETKLYASQHCVPSSPPSLLPLTFVVAFISRILNYLCRRRLRRRRTLSLQSWEIVLDIVIIVIVVLRPPPPSSLLLVLGGRLVVGWLGGWFILLFEATYELHLFDDVFSRFAGKYVLKKM